MASIQRLILLALLVFGLPNFGKSQDTTRIQYDTVRYEIGTWRDRSDWSTVVPTLQKNPNHKAVFVSADGVWLCVVRRRFE